MAQELGWTLFVMDDGEYLYLAVQFAYGAADPGCFLSISKTFQISLPARNIGI